MCIYVVRQAKLFSQIWVHLPFYGRNRSKCLIIYFLVDELSAWSSRVSGFDKFVRLSVNCGELATHV